MTEDSTNFVNSIVQQLENGAPHADSVGSASLLLERAGQLKTGLEYFDAIDVTKKQAERLKQALLHALASHPPVGVRGAIVRALALSQDPGLKKILARELRTLRAAMPETSAAMFQVNLALERLGEAIFPDELESRSADDVELNWQCSQRYLAKTKD